MLGRIAGKIVAWQIRKGILSQEETAVYQYAYELLLNQVINIFLAGLVAVLFRAPAAVALFLLCYIPLRSFSGGYHADTNLGCTVVSALIISIVCCIYNMTNGGCLIWYPVIYIGSGYIINRYAPVQDHNKPLDDLEMSRYRKRSHVIWAAEVILGCILYYLGIRLGVIVAASHMVLSVMLEIGIKKNQIKRRDSGR